MITAIGHTEASSGRRIFDGTDLDAAAIFQMRASARNRERGVHVLRFDQKIAAERAVLFMEILALQS